MLDAYRTFWLSPTGCDAMVLPLKRVFALDV